IFTVAGDRRDADIIRQGALIGDLFDFVILYEDACRRGRADGAVTALIRQGLAEGRRVSGTYETRGERNAVSYALESLKPGDLLLIQVDQIEQTLCFVKSFLDREPAWTEPELEPERLVAVPVACTD